MAESAATKITSAQASGGAHTGITVEVRGWKAEGKTAEEVRDCPQVGDSIIVLQEQWLAREPSRKTTRVVEGVQEAKSEPQPSTMMTTRGARDADARGHVSLLPSSSATFWCTQALQAWRRRAGEGSGVLALGYRAVAGP
jgi:hypothetical protein